MTHCSSVFFADSEHVMADGILCYLTLNLPMHFRVWSRSPVTFKTKLYVIRVNNRFQPLLHHRCCIGIELNNLRWFRKVLEGVEGHLHPSPRCPKNTFSEVFHLKLSNLHHFILSILNLNLILNAKCYCAQHHC